MRSNRSPSESSSAASFHSAVHSSTLLLGEKVILPVALPLVPGITKIAPIRKRPILLTLVAVCIGVLVANVLFRLALLRHGPSTYSDFQHYLFSKLIAGHHSQPLNTRLLAGSKPLIVALVSFSARSRTQLLDCYLQQNLVRNGGLVDRVLFTQDTDSYDELDWLKKLVSNVDGYNLLTTHYSESDSHYQGLHEKTIPIYEARGIKGPLGKSWKLTHSLSQAMTQDEDQPDPLWLFMNSETIYLSPKLVTSLVYTHQTQPQYSIIQANLVNQQTLSWIHNKLGTTKPYRPEGARLEQLAQAEMPKSNDGVFDTLKEQLRNAGVEKWADSGEPSEVSWRASELPMWSKEDATTFSPADSGASPSPMIFGVPVDFTPPMGKHRWLPFDVRTPTTSSQTEQLDFRQRPSISNPITQHTFVSTGPGKWPWTLFAQQLYSFLEHLEEECREKTSGTHNVARVQGLTRYHFPLWSYETEHISLSLFIISSADVQAATPDPNPFPFDADEADVGRWVLKDEVTQVKLGGRGAVIDGHAVAARFAPARVGDPNPWLNEDIGSALERTDLLERFRAYGREVGCAAGI